MNRFILSILTISFPLQLSGQMFPLSDHYLFNGLAVNPAFAGCQDALSTTLMYRNQWVGFKDSPKSYIISVHAPVNNDRIGLGLLIENNSIGIFKETSILGNYAYRMDVRNGKLALGLGFGVKIYNVAWNELEVADANDAQLINNPASAVLPTFSLGAYYYTKTYYIGISIPMFLSYEINKSTGNYRTGKIFSGCNYFLTGGYEVIINPNVKLLPSVLIKYHPDNAVQIDFNTRVSLKERFWIGLGYRTKDMLIGMLECQINYQLRMAYSYDFNFGSIGKYLNGSHEIGLNYVLKYSRKVIGPRQF